MEFNEGFSSGSDSNSSEKDIQVFQKSKTRVKKRKHEGDEKLPSVLRISKDAHRKMQSSSSQSNANMLQEHKTILKLGHTELDSSKQLKLKKRELKSVSMDTAVGERTLTKHQRLAPDRSDSDDDSDSSGPMEVTSSEKGVSMETVAGSGKSVGDEGRMASSSLEEEGEGEDQSSTTDEYAAIRKELSTMSFEELRILRERLGTKVFNQIVHGNTRKEAPTVRTKKTFKRDNKNRPMEMSSKRPVPRFREVVQLKKKMSRDPRFDDLSGEFKEEIFEKTYSFLKDVRANEKEKLAKQLKKTKNDDKKKEIKSVINRMNQREVSDKQKERQEETAKEWKKKEQEMVRQGKTPFFLKKSEKKKLELADKYKELTKSGKIDTYLSKKRKKNAQKERKKLPDRPNVFS